ncbi:MAG TPA: hypothetical protein VGV38_01830 [Pyrinomonadaceae bacterium]|nr:hypothetical protein [Pyrinomonadaceae bacterium]
MFTSRHLKSLLLLAASLLALQPSAAAQSGRQQPPPLSPVPPEQPAPAPTPAGTTNFEGFRLVVSRGPDAFVRDLNEQGRLGYRVEKSVGYGNNTDGWTYAGLLRHEPGHTYEYAYDPLPDNLLYGHPLDYRGRQGYQLAGAYATVKCQPKQYGGDPEFERTEEILRTMFGTVRGNGFLFMRRAGAVAGTTRSYKLYRGTIGLGENLRETVQAAIEEAPPGFRPVRFLFAGNGTLGSELSVVLERDHGEAAPEGVRYRLVKGKRDLVKELNRLAAGGARYVAGGRIGPWKVALVAEGWPGASAYTFLDDHKAAKRFDQMVAAGYSYQGLMGGDPQCDFAELVSQKLVLAREAGGPSRRYKHLSLPEPRAGKPPTAALAELQRLTGEGFRVRELFYSYGLHLILEK